MLSTWLWKLKLRQWFESEQTEGSVRKSCAEALTFSHTLRTYRHCFDSVSHARCSQILLYVPRNCFKYCDVYFLLFSAELVAQHAARLVDVTYVRRTYAVYRGTLLYNLLARKWFKSMQHYVSSACFPSGWLVYSFFFALLMYIVSAFASTRNMRCAPAVAIDIVGMLPLLLLLLLLLLSHTRSCFFSVLIVFLLPRRNAWYAQRTTNG